MLHCWRNPLNSVILSLNVSCLLCYSGFSVMLQWKHRFKQQNWLVYCTFERSSVSILQSVLCLLSVTKDCILHFVFMWSKYINTDVTFTQKSVSRADCVLLVLFPRLAHRQIFIATVMKRCSRWLLPRCSFHALTEKYEHVDVCRYHKSL